MAIISRIIGQSMLTAGLGAGLPYIVFGLNRDSNLIALLFTCVGGIIGAVAGTAREIVVAQRQKPDW